MRRRDFLSLVTATAACPFAAIAQSKAVARIGIIGSLGQSAIDAFKDGLREFGLVDGETIIVVGDPASAASPETVSETVSSLIEQKIDLIFASGALAGRTAKDATSTIPIVCLTGDGERYEEGNCICDNSRSNGLNGQRSGTPDRSLSNLVAHS